MREGHREELTGLRQTTKNGCGSALLPSSPSALQGQHIQRFPVKMKKSVVDFEDYFPKMSRCKEPIWHVRSGGQGLLSQVEAVPLLPFFPLPFLSVFWHQKEQRKSKALKGFPQR